MPKYLFKALDAASGSGPGPTLWFQSPTSFKDMFGQISTPGITGLIPNFAINMEVTLNGTDFRPVSGVFGSNILSSTFPVDGAYARLGPVGLMMGFRLNLQPSFTAGTITLLLAIDQEA